MWDGSSRPKKIRSDAYVCRSSLSGRMCAGRVACCPLTSHVEYVPRALLRFEQTAQTDRRTYARRYITLTARRGQRNNRVGRSTFVAKTTRILHIRHTVPCLKGRSHWVRCGAVRQLAATLRTDTRASTRVRTINDLQMNCFKFNGQSQSVISNMRSIIETL